MIGKFRNNTCPLKLLVAEESDLPILLDNPDLFGAGLPVEGSLFFHLLDGVRLAEHLNADLWSQCRRVSLLLHFSLSVGARPYLIR